MKNLNIQKTKSPLQTNKSLNPNQFSQSKSSKKNRQKSREFSKRLF
jgi:hypothetical protein